MSWHAVLRDHLPLPVIAGLLSVRCGETRLQRAAIYLLKAGGRRWRSEARLDGSSVPLALGDQASEVMRDLRAAFDQAGLEYAVLTNGARGRPRVVVASDRRDQAIDSLQTSAVSPWWVQARRSPTSRLGRAQRVDAHRVHLSGTAGVRVLRKPPAIFDRALADVGVEVEFWEAVTESGTRRSGGGELENGTLIAPTPNRTASHVSPAVWRSIQARSTHGSSDHQHVLDVVGPIDLVYTWVDGSDPDWLARMQAAVPDVNPTEHNFTALVPSRFADRAELRYSLRSVEMFAEWINHVYVVTDGQRPPWLRDDHPKLTIVQHEEIFSDPSALPVFNSHAIESQLHHIPGLTERYLYLNDDVFFGRPVRPELFFHSNGLAKFFLSEAVIDLDPPSPRDLPITAATKRTRQLIEEQFGTTLTHKLKHTPHPQIRAVLNELEERFPRVFESVLHSKFRHPDDLSIASNLHHYYAYCEGRAVPGDISYVYQDLTRHDAAVRLQWLLQRRAADTFCLNDTYSRADQRRNQVDLLSSFLKRYFPTPSSFETDPT